MDAISHWKGGYQCRVSIRDHEVAADEPPEVGGTNIGPTPTELLLAALTSCYTMALFHVAKRQDLDLPDDLRVGASKFYDGQRLSRITVEVQTDQPFDELEDLMPRAAKLCFVSNTLMGSTEVTYQVG